MTSIHEIQSFQHSIMTLSLCLLHLEKDDLSIDKSLHEALVIVNISNSLTDLVPADRMLKTITKNLNKVSNAYISNPQSTLLDIPVHDTLYQLRYNLRITLDYIIHHYGDLE